MTRKLLLLNVAALSPWEIGSDCPNLLNLAQSGSLNPLVAPEPSLTCPSHATMVTGLSPKEHGIVANGWYEEPHGKIFNWGRSDKLVTGERIWQAAKKRDQSFTSANLFWRFCTHSDCDLTVTERPTYFANGRKGADIYSSDPAFKDAVIQELGSFPFFHFWGPKAGMNSSRWIVSVARKVIAERSPNLLMVYAPGLDYEGQRFGPKSAQARRVLTEGDSVFAALFQDARAADMDIAVVSDYGFTTVERPIFLNRVLRENGFLAVDNAANGEWLEPNASKAFAVCDNQAAHIYVRDSSNIEAVRQCMLDTPGVHTVLGPAHDASVCLGHPRSGTLLAVADADAWFAYPYWLDENKKPDFATCVDIFNKPGFDPCEMFMREGFGGTMHAAKRFAQLKLGIRAPFDVISNRYDAVRGARNIRPKSLEDGAIFITSWSHQSQGPVPMTDVKDIILERLFS